jgi:hypothetical protein
LYNGSNEVNEVEMDREFSMNRKEGQCIQGFGMKARRKTQLERMRCRCEDNIKVDLREIGCALDRIDLA